MSGRSTGRNATALRRIKKEGKVNLNLVSTRPRLNTRSQSKRKKKSPRIEPLDAWYRSRLTAHHDADEFVRKLKLKFFPIQGRHYDENWLIFGHVACTVFNGVPPHVCFLNGLLEESEEAAAQPSTASARASTSTSDAAKRPARAGLLEESEEAAQPSTALARASASTSDTAKRPARASPSVAGKKPPPQASSTLDYWKPTLPKRRRTAVAAKVPAPPAQPSTSAAAKRPPQAPSTESKESTLDYGEPSTAVAAKVPAPPAQPSTSAAAKRPPQAPSTESTEPTLDYGEPSTAVAAKPPPPPPPPSTSAAAKRPPQSPSTESKESTYDYWKPSSPKRTRRPDSQEGQQSRATQLRMKKELQAILTVDESEEVREKFDEVLGNFDKKLLQPKGSSRIKLKRLEASTIRH
ncbi:unnamed protein product [Cylindrotheca closterium]|uniref:Uncharacterized protein n=1 Tax=Cylindrotheca closterium TaxID=2856 RepID=A0AAD2CG44_9STRA|nr:unnamed protein product [Cylindrotheca closterium]